MLKTTFSWSLRLQLFSPAACFAVALDGGFSVSPTVFWKRLSQFRTVRFTMGFVFNGPCLCKGSLYSFSSVHFPLLKSILWCCFPCSTSLPHFTIDPLNLLCKLCLLFVQSISLSFSHFLLECAIQPYFSAGTNGQAFSNDASSATCLLIIVGCLSEFMQWLQNISKDEVVLYSQKVMKKGQWKEYLEDNVCAASFGTNVRNNYW